MVKVKGSVVSEGINAARTRLGTTRFQQLLSLLDEEARTMVEEPISAMSWVPLDVWVRFLKADVDLTEKGNGQALVARAEGVIERQLNGIYKAFVKESPEALVRSLTGIAGSYYQGVKAEAKMTGPKAAVVRYVGFEKQHQLAGYSIVGFCRKALEFSGAKNVVARFTTSIEDDKGFSELVMSWD
jgi:hypothetical protein